MTGRRGGRPPLLVEVAELLRAQGSRRRFQQTVDLDGLHTTSAEVAGPLEVDVELEAQGSQIIVDGAVRGRWRGECRRCLDEVVADLDAEVREVFEPRPVDGETYLLAGDEVDLEEMVRDAVLLTLPLAPLCAEECSGPDPDRFSPVGNAPADDEAGGGSAPDPRWAALDQLDFD
ncbi:MAG: DUF177 domain-containing protein [Acidimicrobiales bacterium]|nr:DUF177 domain-containing protein [Acidimicrobiales bacterium]